jgi:hypothetical protein
MSAPSDDTPSGSGGDEHRSGGIDVEGDASVGGDVAGRDVVKSTTLVGFSERAVLRLVIVVGALVFVTAACFFTGGIVLGSRVFAALERPPNDGNGQPTVSTPQTAEAFAQQIAEAQQVPAGQAYLFPFSEDQLSSYFRFIAGPEIGVQDGKVRFVEPGVIALSGQVQDLGDRNVAATYRIEPRTDEPLQLESAAVQVVPTGGSFGWVAVPTALLSSFSSQVNQVLSDVTLLALQANPGAWEWTAVAANK